MSDQISDKRNISDDIFYVEIILFHYFLRNEPFISSAIPFITNRTISWIIHSKTS